MAAAESFSSAAFAPWWVVGLDFQLPDYQITQLPNLPRAPSPAIHRTRSQSSQFGVDFSCCCPSWSRDQPINRSPDFCLSPRLRASVVGVRFCLSDLVDVARWRRSRR